MATSNKKIFDKFLGVIEDRKLCKLSDEDLASVLTIYQNASSSLYFKKCRKDLSLYQDSEFYRQSFTGDGITTEFVISQYKTGVATDSLENFCQSDSIVPIYSFNSSTLTYTITPAPITGADINCGYDYIGEFDEDLSDEECWIIAYGMLVAWTDSNINVESKLRQTMTTKNYNPLHSPANLLKELMALGTYSFKRYRTLMVSYTKESMSEEFNGIQ